MYDRDVNVEMSDLEHSRDESLRSDHKQGGW